MTRPRFTTLEVHGYRTATHGKKGSGPGVTATVYDRLLDLEIAHYRSEDLRGGAGKRRGVAGALRDGREHARRLNAGIA